MAWSERQQAVIAIVPKFSASLSIIGSSCIIVECLFVDRRKLERVYHRILLAMSIIDVIESSWNFCSTWPIPRGTRGVAFAAGNVTTCTAQGFILEFGLAIPMLNMCLSIYYLLVIKYSWSEDKIRKRAEPWFHGVSLCVALAFALAGIPMKLYNNANLWCWFAPLPLDCKDTFRFGDEANCIRGDNAWIYRWAFYYSELWFCILFVMFAMLTVYLEVRRLERANRKFDFRTSASGHIQPNSAGSLFQRSRQGSTFLFRRRSSSTLSGHRRRPSKSRQVATQALWYVGAFYLTFTFATINRLIQQIAGKTYFATTVLHTIFEPSQGFFNYLVYLRPRYISFKEKNPDVPWYKALGKVIFPDEQTFERQRTSRYIDTDHEDEELARSELQHFRSGGAATANYERRSSDVPWYVNDNGENCEQKGDDSGKASVPTEHSSSSDKQGFLQADEANDNGGDVYESSNNEPNRTKRVCFLDQPQRGAKEVAPPTSDNIR